MLTVEDKRNYFVAKGNEIIQKSRYTMTAQQFDLLTYVISMVKKGDIPEQTYKFTLKEFCQLCNKDYKNGWYYVSIKDDLKTIADTSVYVPIEPQVKGRKRERLVRWFNKVETENGGNFEVSFHYTMYPYIYELTDKYSMIQVKYILPLETFAAKRLYEILRSYQISPVELRKEYSKAVNTDTLDDFYKRERVVKTTIDLEELKLKLACNAYDRYVDFSRYFLDKAIEEINRYTDIEVSYTGKTSKGTGRKITGIEFTIKLLARDYYNDERQLNREIYYYDEVREEHTDENGKTIWHTFEDGQVKHIGE